MEKTTTQRVNEEPKFEPQEIPSEIHGVKLSKQSQELLSRGEWSELLEGMYLDDSTVKNGKVRFTREKNGEVKVNYLFQQEQLIIPEKLGDYKLSQDDKIKLTNGQTIGPIKYDKNELFVKVDKDLNSVVVSSRQELGIPNVIGNNDRLNFKGYKLTDEDKNKLANGGQLSPKLFAGKDGYFIAKFSMTDDRMGVVFSDIQSIPFNKVQEYEEKLNYPLPAENKNSPINDVLSSGNDTIKENNINMVEQITHTGNNLLDEPKKLSLDSKTEDIMKEAEGKFSTKSEDFKYIILSETDKSTGIDKFQICDKIDQVKDKITEMKSLEIKDYPNKYSVYLIDPSKVPSKDGYEPDRQNTYEKDVINQTKETGLIISNSQETEKFIRQEQEFHKALEDRDFTKLNNLYNDGFKPSDKNVENIEDSTKLSKEDKIAIQTIFHIEPDKSPDPLDKNVCNDKPNDNKKSNDVKFTKNENEEPGKNQNNSSQKIKDLAHQTFNNM